MTHPAGDSFKRQMCCPRWSPAYDDLKASCEGVHDDHTHQRALEIQKSPCALLSTSAERPTHSMFNQQPSVRARRRKHERVMHLVFTLMNLAETRQMERARFYAQVPMLKSHVHRALEAFADVAITVLEL